jgi:hypothetical protein
VSNASYAVVGAVGGGLVSALTALVVALFQRRATVRDSHLQRAFERHYRHYEAIFTSCRTVLDSVDDYAVIEGGVEDRSDPFLFQLLDIVRDSAYKYCLAVDWKHNPGMAYLEMGLEEKCLRLRDLLLEWMSVSRVTYGDLASIRRAGETLPIPLAEVRNLAVGSYTELILERRQVVLRDANDPRLIADIRAQARTVIKELKAVMAY